MAKDRRGGREKVRKRKGWKEERVEREKGRKRKG
jgi:hypothetical protein